MIRDVIERLEGFATDGSTMEPYEAGDLAADLDADRARLLVSAEILARETRDPLNMNGVAVDAAIAQLWTVARA